MKQGVIQTPEFWQTQFQITDQMVESLYNSFLEAGEPKSIDEISLFFAQEAIELEERKIRSELEQGKPYRPDQDFEVDEKLVFSHLNYATGTVVGKREGHNPTDGEFTVLDMVFEEYDDLSMSFAASLTTPHALLQGEGDQADSDGHASVLQKTYGQFQHLIRPKAAEALKAHGDFVSFGHQWFLKDLIVQVEEGLLNIVDAAIDINGGPLNADALIEQIELGNINDTLRFSVNHCLAQDDRFDNVGTDDNVLWYLQRLKPPRVLRLPRRLREDNPDFDVNRFNSEQRALLAEIDDEATPAEYLRPVDPHEESVTIVLNYPHRRLGTLPVTPAVRHLLPEANGRLLALELVDGRTGDSMLTWYVSQFHYILGLADWYQKYQIPVGAFIMLTRTDDQAKLVVDLVPQRTQQEYVRVAMVNSGKLIFEIKKRRLTCRYDELMIIGEEGSEGINVLWDQVEEKGLTIYDLLIQVMPELIKLTTQGAVHIKTIYSAINVMKRVSPGPLMEELIINDSFISMGHGYWSYKP